MAKQTRTTAFDSFHEFVYTKLRVNFTKDVNMVGHHFQFQYLTSRFFCDLVDDCFQSSIHPIYQDVPPILRTKDNMIFAGIQDKSVAFIVHTFLYNRFLSTVKIGGLFCQYQSKGGTPQFGKTILNMLRASRLTGYNSHYRDASSPYATVTRRLFLFYRRLGVWGTNRTISIP